MISLLAEENDLEELLKEVNFSNILYQGDYERGCVINELMEVKLKTNKKFFLDNHSIGIICDYNKEKIDHLTDAIIHSAFDNSGQSEYSLKNLHIHSSVYTEFMDSLIAKISKLKLGNPLDDETQQGPICKEKYLHEGQQLVTYYD